MVSLPPPRTTELFYGGQWSTVPVLERSSITISRGVSSEGSRATPTKATGVLIDNRSGDYAPRNPLSPLYGEIGRNTPFKFSIDAGSPWVALPTSTDKLTTPDNAQLAITGDVDIRIDVALDDWRTAQELAGRYEITGDNRAWALIIASDGSPVLLWSPDGTLASRITAAGTEPVPVHAGQRVCLRATIDVDNGAGGYDVRFYTGLTVDDDNWLQFGDTLTGSGSTSVFDGTAGVEIGNIPDLTDPGAVGRVYALKVLGGGATVVDLDLGRDAAVGEATVTDTTGLVWTLSGGTSLTNSHVRLVGEVPAWPPSRDLSGQDRTVAIEPTGIMRRLGAGNKPLDSALRRYIAGSTAAECWPLTDGPESAQAASLLGGAPMVYSHDADDDPPEWAKGTVADWLEPVVQLPGNGKLIGSLPYLTSMETGWSVDHVRSGPGETDQIHMHDWGAGTDEDNRHTFELFFQAPLDRILVLRESVGATSSSGASLATIDPAGIYDGRPHHIRFRALPIGADLFWYVIIDGVVAASGDIPLTIKPLRRVEYWWGANEEDLALGYVTCWAEDPVPPDAFEVYDAMMGFPGETAGERALRVAGEQGVPLTVAGAVDEQTRLGTQRPEKFLDVLNTAAKSDLGYVLEQRDARALVYRGRATLYNQTPVLTLDWTDAIVADPFAPTDDDKNTENDVAVKREGGSTGYAVLEEGRMSVLDPPDGVGRYDRAHTLSLEDDDQAPQHAYWRMHLGTFDGLRYTSITLDLANPRVYALIDQIMRADVGHKIRLTNLPAEYGPDDVDLIIRGYKETVSDKKWRLTFNCSPGEPWTVGVVGESRVDTAKSVLAAAVDADDTSLLVNATRGSGWVRSTKHPTDFPFDVRVGGEVVTVAACTGVAEDSFERTVAPGWGTADSGQAWTTSGGAVADYEVTGTGRHVLNSRGEFRIATVPVLTPDVDLQFDFSLDAAPAGDSAYVYAPIRYTDDTHFYFARVQISSGGAFSLSLRKRNGSETLLTSVSPGITLVAGTWYTLRVAMTGSTLTAKVWQRGSTEPDWQLSTTDTDLTAAGSVGARSFLGPSTTNPLPVTLQVDNLLAGPRLFTATRSVNGVSKSHAAGADVRLAHPTIVALSS
ncbi:hypothetical protein AB0903_09005 [Streptomyces sp. NPDC048389]|uniref:hypothetical protein n=1 Tax=Streptomyces sp. NPDC048389 TaxID=3154622 RepID=UPI00345451C8